MDLDFQPENLPPRPEKGPSGPPTPPISPPPAHQAGPPPGPAPVSMVSNQPKPVDMPMHDSAIAGLPHMVAQTPAKKSRLPLIIAILAIVIAVVIAVVYVVRTRQASKTDTTTFSSTDTVPSFEEESSLGESTNSLPSSTTPAGRDAQRKQDVQQISTLLQAYFADNQTYPVSGEIDKLNVSSSILAKELVPKYTSKLPVDPLDPDFFYGYSSKDGKTYELSSRLEVSTDPQASLIGSKYLFVIKK